MVRILFKTIAFEQRRIELSCGSTLRRVKADGTVTGLGPDDSAVRLAKRGLAGGHFAQIRKPRFFGKVFVAL